MKKLVIFAVCALMSATASFGFNFTFAEVTKVEQSGNGFIAYAGGESVKISALQYTQMKDATGYYLLSVDGKKVVAAGGASGCRQRRARRQFAEGVLQGRHHEDFY